MSQTKLWYLKNLDIFDYLSDKEVKMIDAYTNMREVKKGETLYLQGGADKNFFMLKKGAVKITKVTPQVHEIILEMLKNGSIFGEMGVIEPRERNESAVALEDSLICTMRKEDFDYLAQRIPGLAMRMTKMIGLKRWKIENKLLDLLYCTVEQRIAKTLLNLLDDFGVPYKDGYLLKVKLTHKDYAGLIASTRETVTTAFNKLKNESIIYFEGKYVVIKSMDKLKLLANSIVP